MGTFDLHTAMVEKRLEKAQKAYDYFSRALADKDHPEKQSAILKMQDQAKAMITQLQAQGPQKGADGTARMPSSTAPAGG